MEDEVAGWFYVIEQAGPVLYLWLIMNYQDIKYYRSFVCMGYRLTGVFITLLLRQ